MSLICVNRSLTATADLELVAHGWGGVAAARGQTITGSRERHDGTFEPLEVVVKGDDTVRCTLAPGSFTVVDLELGTE